MKFLDIVLFIQAIFNSSVVRKQLNNIFPDTQFESWKVTRINQLREYSFRDAKNRCHYRVISLFPLPGATICTLSHSFVLIRVWQSHYNNTVIRSDTSSAYHAICNINKFPTLCHVYFIIGNPPGAYSKNKKNPHKGITKYFSNIFIKY